MSPDFTHAPVPKAHGVMVLVQMSLIRAPAVLSTSAMVPAVVPAMLSAILTATLPLGDLDVGGVGTGWAGRIAAGLRHTAS